MSDERELGTQDPGSPANNDFDREGLKAALKAIKAADAKRSATVDPGDLASAGIKQAMATPSETVEESETTSERATEAPEVAEVVEPDETALTKQQQIKLRVRQEAQRIRAKALEEAKKIEEQRREFESEKQRVLQEKSEYEKKMQELESLKRKARETPDDFFSEVGTSLDEIVRGKLEDGKPESRISNLERQIDMLVKELKQRDLQMAERDAKAEADRKQQAEENQRKEYERQKIEAEQKVVKMAADDPEKYPVLNRLVKRNPMVVITNAYTAYGIYKEENGGREPSFEEILATAEKLLGGDDEPVVAPRKRVSPASKGGGAGVPIKLEDLDETARRKLAIKELKAMRASGG